MTVPTGSRRSRAERRRQAAATAALLRRRVLGAALAVVLVLAFVGLLVTTRGHEADRNASFVRTVSSPAPRAAAPAASPSSTPAPSLSAAPTRSPGPAATAGSTAKQIPSPPARAPLTVLNNSMIHGLAEQAAARFRAEGWQVRTVGNFTGRTPATTIYYGPGEYAAAVELARETPGAQPVLPRIAGLPGSGLTIVLTSDFRS